MPLGQWYCDVCDEIIEEPQDGYVIWGSDGDLLEFGFKIIHQSRCDYNKNTYTSSMPLKSFLGGDGLSYLLSFLSLGPIKFNISRDSFRRVRDVDEFVDFFRRVQIPYYEEARRRFRNSELLRDFSDANEFAAYRLDTLRAIIQGYQPALTGNANGVILT